MSGDSITQVVQMAGSGAKSIANEIDKLYNNTSDAYGRFTNAMQDVFSPLRWF